MICTGALSEVGDGTMGWLAKRTFEYHNPDVDLIYIDENMYSDLKHKHQEQMEMLQINPEPGTFRWFYAYHLLKTKKYDKVIVLGADTISFGPCKELYNHTGDVGVTFDYNYPIGQCEVPTLAPEQNGVIRTLHFNADVVCFKNPEFIKFVFNNPSCGAGTIFKEQAPLNYLCLNDDANSKYGYNCDIIEYPYGKFYYNVSSKGSEYEDYMGTRVYFDPRKFKLKDTRWGKRVYHPNGVMIKIFHFCDGLSNRPHIAALCAHYFETMFPDNIVNYLEEITELKLRGIWTEK